jgi:carbonic anhydrase/acetyltransferase-like protein (isoleucine patch superfamily)
MIIPFDGKQPVISPSAFIAPTATIIGDVVIAEGSSIWYGTVLRGDLSSIHIGANTNVQDNVTIHVDLDTPATIGDNVVIGHNAVVHGCTIESKCLVGINSIILNNAHLKTGSMVAAGSVVKQGQMVGPSQLVAGIPAVVKKELQEKNLSKIDSAVQGYVRIAKMHQAELEKLNQ